MRNCIIGCEDANGIENAFGWHHCKPLAGNEIKMKINLASSPLCLMLGLAMKSLLLLSQPALRPRISCIQFNNLQRLIWDDSSTIVEQTVKNCHQLTTSNCQTLRLNLTDSPKGEME